MQNRTVRTPKYTEANLRELTAFFGLMQSMSGKWKLAIFWALRENTLRFGELRRVISRIFSTPFRDGTKNTKRRR
jgi:DNA-binding HxlR family transcriptional regulator